MPREVYASRAVEVPEGVNVEVEGFKVRVRGPRGVVERDFSFARGVSIRVEGGSVVVEAYFPKSRGLALVGSIASHIENMIVGVTRGFRYKLKVIYVHYPINVRVDRGRLLITNFLGEKSVRHVEIPSGVKVTVSGQDIIVEGSDIELVGQTAANIENATRVKGRDRRKYVDGIYIYAREVM
ncbi:MAG: 50S ribosomal protein L6 [Thermoprotei archaeon]|nr:50S ribosomal protein L6 [Thermoprotei archaeon]